MAKPIDIYNHLINLDEPKLVDYWEHLNPILKYIDHVLYENENLIYSYDYEYNKNNFQVPLRFYTKQSDLKLMSLNDWQERIDEIFEVTIKFFSIRKTVIKQVIFMELRQFMLFYTEELYENPVFSIKEPISVEEKTFYKQCETYEYMFTFFDKLYSIFRHLNDKYISPEKDTPLDAKFFNDILPSILCFAKDDESRVQLRETITKMTDSTLYHLMRKLRNKIAHEFVVPNKKYNLTYEIKLLYINICRIVFLLDATIKNDSELKEFVNSKG